MKASAKPTLPPGWHAWLLSFPNPFSESGQETEEVNMESTYLDYFYAWYWLSDGYAEAIALKKIQPQKE